MMPPSILLATDFSGRCDRARDRAIALAQFWNTNLIVLHVLADTASGTAPDARLEDEARAQARLRAEVKDAAITVMTRVATGNVAEAIIDAAAEWSAGIVVTAPSRREDLGDHIVGTTLERVLRRSPAPVLIVKRFACS